VVALSASQYQHPNPAYGKIWNPKFQITSWAPWTGAVFGEFGDAVRDIPASEIERIKQPAAPKAKALGATANYREECDDIPY
jgi:hypothetical protein